MEKWDVPADERPDYEGLENFLKTATILSQEELVDPGFHHGKQSIVFDGGVQAIAKPLGGCLTGEWLIRCEAGAWTAAKTLGWPDLVPVTILRTLPILSSDCGIFDAHHPCSVQLQIGDFIVGHWSNDFDPDAVLRAAVFDYILGQSDRESRNWLTISRRHNVPRFLLHDNGFACLPPARGRVFASRFFTEAEGRELPDSLLAAVEGFLQRVDYSELADTLPPLTYNGVVGRARYLLEVGRVQAAPDIVRDLASRS